MLDRVMPVGKVVEPKTYEHLDYVERILKEDWGTEDGYPLIHYDRGDGTRVNITVQKLQRALKQAKEKGRQEGLASH